MKQTTLIGISAGVFVTVVSVLADADSAIDFVNKIPIGFRVVAFGIAATIAVLVIYSPIFYRNERIRKEREDKIFHLQQCIARFGEPGATLDAREFLQQHGHFLELQPFLSDEFKAQLVAYDPTKPEADPKHPALIANFLSELAKLSKKWRASPYR